MQGYEEFKRENDEWSRKVGESLAELEQLAGERAVLAEVRAIVKAWKRRPDTLLGPSKRLLEELGAALAARPGEHK